LFSLLTRLALVEHTIWVFAVGQTTVSNGRRPVPHP
jgi:hypothetical protein